MKLKEKIKKSWSNPVLSKIIAVLIINIFASLKTFISSIQNETSFFYEFKKLWDKEIKLWMVITAIVFLYAVFNTFKWLKNKKSNKFVYDEETLKLDKNLFDKIKERLIAKKSLLLKYSSFSNRPIRLNEIKFISEILNENDDPSFEFIHPKLEELKEDFLESLRKLESMCNDNLFSINGGNPDSTDLILKIPSEWDIKLRHKIQNEMNIASQDAFEKYESLIKNGRRILKI